MKTGDLVILGKHRLVCGDAFNKEHVDLLMADDRADLLYMDPPYGIKLDTRYSSMPAPKQIRLAKGITGGRDWPAIVGDDTDFDPAPLIAQFDGCPEQFWWGADYYRARLPQGGSWVAWDKRTIASKDRMFGSVFELCWSRRAHRREIARVVWCGVFGTEREPGRKRYHPAHKPVLLCEWFLERYSKPDAIVVDLFAGSGSTLLACGRTGRVARLMEIDPSYCDLILKRWHAFTASARAAHQYCLDLPEAGERDVPGQEPEPRSLQLSLL